MNEITLVIDGIGSFPVTKITEEPYRQQGSAAESGFLRIHVGTQIPFETAGTWLTANIGPAKFRVYVYKVRHRPGRSTLTLISPDSKIGDQTHE
jgi:hypothetical protein